LGLAKRFGVARPLLSLCRLRKLTRAAIDALVPPLKSTIKTLIAATRGCEPPSQS
jgi:hypothetical protein